MSLIAAGGFADVVSERISAARFPLSEQWLKRLEELLTVGSNEVFPSAALLDHIPLLIDQIAGYLRAPSAEAIAANSEVIEKARELGVLRHSQKASVHQLLREYEILGELLETFVKTEVERLEFDPPAAECVEVLQRLAQAIRALMRTTIDTFISEYTTTIQRQSDRWNAFNSMVSHELRNPIGVLTIAADLLGDESLAADPERRAKVLGTVRTHARRLSWLLDNVDRLARLNGPIDVPSEQAVDLNRLAADVARQLEEMAAARRVTIKIDEALPSVVLDPARVELVLLNLTSNSIKYSDPAKPDSFVEITCDRPDASAQTCTLQIKDNGLGIAEADQRLIFDRFFRAHAHLDAKLGIAGTGLGLTIVAECVQALGGTIQCESTVGVGTTFTMTLPRVGRPQPRL